MPLIFLFVIVAQVGAAPPVPPEAAPTAPSGAHAFRHFRHYRRFHGSGAHLRQPVPLLEDVSGESFVKDGRRYYWFVQNGRRVYSSHPPAGYRPAFGPTLQGMPQNAIADLDAPLSHTEQAAQAERMRQAQARLALLEDRIGRLRHLERLRARPSRPVKKPK